MKLIIPQAYSTDISELGTVMFFFFLVIQKTSCGLFLYRMEADVSRTGQNGEGCGEIQARTASADSYGSIQCYVSSQKGPGV